MQLARLRKLIFSALLCLVSATGLHGQSPADTYPEVLGVAHDTVFRPDHFGGEAVAGPCPPGWPRRIEVAFQAAEIEPLSEQCRAVIRDFNGDGTLDAVLAVPTSLGVTIVGVLDTPSPMALKIERLEPDTGYIYEIDVGQHRLSGCFDGPYGDPEMRADRIVDPADGELSFPYGGFGVSDGWWVTYYHFRDDGLHQEGGSGC